MARRVSFWDMIPGEMVPRIPAAWSGDLEQHPGAARMVSTGQGSEARRSIAHVRKLASFTYNSTQTEYIQLYESVIIYTCTVISTC